MTRPDTTRTGGCLCGAVRYAVEGEPRETVHCHCRICQKSSGAAFITWATFAKSSFDYLPLGNKLGMHRSSKYATREFCPACGSQLVFRGDWDSTLDVAVGTLDEPDSVTPTANTWVTARRAWMHGFDRNLADLDGEFPTSND
jgi:hypothetical protein